MAWTSEYMAQDTSSQELEHFGIKGMKWGVRKKGDPIYVGKSGVTIGRNGLKIPSSVERGRNLSANGEKIKTQRPVLRAAGIVSATAMAHGAAFCYSVVTKDKLRAINAINTTTLVAQGAMAVNTIAGVRRWSHNRDLNRYYDSHNNIKRSNKYR